MNNEFKKSLESTEDLESHFIPVLAQESDIDELVIFSQKTFSKKYADHINSFNVENLLESFLEKTFSRKKFLEGFADDSVFYYVLKQNQQIIAYSKLRFIQDDDKEESNGEVLAYIDQIYVGTEYRSLGVGKTFMKTIEKLSRAKKATEIQLACWDGNARAIQFYEKMGYKKHCTERFYISEDVYDTDIIFQKELS